jgi:hypothetical protein
MAGGPECPPGWPYRLRRKYRSRLSVWAPGAGVAPYVYVGGGPNATALGADGCIYVTQNGASSARGSPRTADHPRSSA